MRTSIPLIVKRLWRWVLALAFGLALSLFLIYTDYRQFLETPLSVSAEGLTLEIKPGDIVNIPIQVATYPEYATKGSHPIEFSFRYHTEDKQEWRTINEDSNFIGE